MEFHPPPGFDLDRPAPEHLLWAYRHGLFPMAAPRTGLLDWHCPDPRGVIPLDAFHVPRRLARTLRQNRFELCCDTAFEAVMRACAQPRPRSDNALSWINDELIEAYTALHERGHAHSIEAWREGELVGGIYGAHIGGAFFGESMFSCERDASKVCLVHTVRWLRQRGFLLFDTQFCNPHIAQFGCIEIPRNDYLTLLARAIAIDIDWGTFAPTDD